MISVNDIYAQLVANQEVRHNDLINPCLKHIDLELEKAIIFPVEIRYYSSEKGQYIRLFLFELLKIKTDYSLLGWKIKTFIWSDGWKRKYFFGSSNKTYEFKLEFYLPSASLIFWRKIKNYLLSCFKKEKFLLPKKSVYRD